MKSTMWMMSIADKLKGIERAVALRLWNSRLTLFPCFSYLCGGHWYPAILFRWRFRRCPLWAPIFGDVAGQDWTSQDIPRQLQTTLRPSLARSKNIPEPWQTSKTTILNECICWGVLLNLHEFTSWDVQEGFDLQICPCICPDLARQQFKQIWQGKRVARKTCRWHV